MDGKEKEKMKPFDIVLNKLKVEGSISLMDIDKLAYSDLDSLFEEIKRWKIYGNGNAVLLGKQLKK